jgi:hypothetical protein
MPPTPMSMVTCCIGHLRFTDLTIRCIKLHISQFPTCLKIGRNLRLLGARGDWRRREQQKIQPPLQGRRTVNDGRVSGRRGGDEQAGEGSGEDLECTRGGAVLTGPVQTHRWRVNRTAAAYMPSGCSPVCGACFANHRSNVFVHQ